MKHFHIAYMNSEHAFTYTCLLTKALSSVSRVINTNCIVDTSVCFDQRANPQSLTAERPVPVDLEAARPVEGERQHLLLQENAPPDMTGYILCAACVFFLANPLFGALAFILAGKYYFY